MMATSLSFSTSLIDILRDVADLAQIKPKCAFHVRDFERQFTIEQVKERLRARALSFVQCSTLLCKWMNAKKWRRA